MAVNLTTVSKATKNKTPFPVGKTVFTRPEAMAYLGGIHRNTMARFEKNHNLKRFFIESKPMYRRADLDELIDKLVEKANATPPAGKVA
jgi:hypothetical protein